MKKNNDSSVMSRTNMTSIDIKSPTMQRVKIHPEPLLIAPDSTSPSRITNTIMLSKGGIDEDQPVSPTFNFNRAEAERYSHMNEAPQKNGGTEDILQKRKVLKHSYIILSAALAILYIIILIIGLVDINASYPYLDIMHNQAYFGIEIGLLAIFLIDIVTRMIIFKKWFWHSIDNIFETALCLLGIAFFIWEVTMPLMGFFIGFTRLRIVIRVPRVINLVYYYYILDNSSTNPYVALNPTKSNKFNAKHDYDKIIETLNKAYDKLENTQLKNEISGCLKVLQKRDPMLLFHLTPSMLSPNEMRKVNPSAAKKIGAVAQIAESIFEDVEEKNLEEKNAEEKSVSINYDDADDQTIMHTTKKQSSTQIISDDVPLPSPSLKEKMKLIDELDFNILAYKELAPHGHDLYFMLCYMFHEYSMQENLCRNKKVFLNFAHKLQISYRNVPYHNSTHGADVVQGTHFYLKKCEFDKICELNPQEKAIMIIAAAIHDVDHPGHNNALEISTQSKLALLYNDKAVLENHHLAYCFELMRNESYNIFGEHKYAEYKVLRTKLIELVLATDMSQHFINLNLLKTRSAAEDYEPKGKDKDLILKSLIHAADIGNPTKPFDQCKTWALYCIQEFFAQGDKEKKLGLPVSPLCDRYTTNIAKSQAGFIDFLVVPLFDAVTKINPLMNVCLTSLRRNKEEWNVRLDEYEELMKKESEKDEE